MTADYPALVFGPGVCPWIITLNRCHNEHEGISNHRRLDCSLNRLFRRRSKKISKLRVTGLCEGNSPVTGEFPTQRSSNAENSMTSSWLQLNCHIFQQGDGVIYIVEFNLPNNSVAHIVWDTTVSGKCTIFLLLKVVIIATLCCKGGHCQIVIEPPRLII